MATLRTLRALICPSCGQILPAAAPGTSVVCGNCGATTALPAPGPAWSEQVDLEDEPEKRSSMLPMLLGCGLGLVVLGALGCCGVGIIGMGGWALMPVQTSNPVVNYPPPPPQIVHTPVTPAPPTHPSGLLPTDFPTMDTERWNPVGIEPPYPYQSFDAVSALPWARDMARKWIPDAEFVRADVDGVRVDGSLDLASNGDNSAGYRFYSPSRAALAAKISSVSEEVPLAGFRILVREGVIYAMITQIDAPSERGWSPLPATTDCSSAALMRAHLAQPKTQRVPTYDLGLRWRGRSHVWTISPGSTYYDPVTCGLTTR